jgi:hypothetical protein
MSRSVISGLGQLGVYVVARITVWVEGIAPREIEVGRGWNAPLPWFLRDEAASVGVIAPRERAVGLPEVVPPLIDSLALANNATDHSLAFSRDSRAWRSLQARMSQWVLGLSTQSNTASAAQV